MKEKARHILCLAFLKSGEKNMEKIFNSNMFMLCLCIAVGVFALISIVSLVLLIVTMVKLKKMRQNYRLFMNGKTAENLEDAMLDHFAKIKDLVELTDKHTNQLASIKEEMKTVYTKLGIVKYDAFNEMGGKLSFALAMLDNSNNGYVINSMHNREGCYTYVKEIIKGESFIPLGDEESKALSQAMGTDIPV